MPLEFQTFSIVTGTPACNAACFFCVSKMTTSAELADELREAGAEVAWPNFHKAARLAQQSGVTTVLLTGKGEPTLYPRQLCAYLEALALYRFPLIELQTNGLALTGRRLSGPEGFLGQWRRFGLNTVILSVVDVDDEANRRVYMPQRAAYPPLVETIALLHDYGYTVRLGLIMLRDLVDTPAQLDRVVAFCRRHRVEQLTVRPVTAPEVSHDPAVSARAAAVRPTADQLAAIQAHVERRGRLLLRLVHGARVYDLEGQNLCLTNCLTLDPEEEELRTLIFFSTGELVYDWQYPGALLLGPARAFRDGPQI